MPEMPEVESLARWLDTRTAGLSVDRADILAISALKTYDPPIDALKGRVVASWTRAGKFLLCKTVPSTLEGGGEPVMYLAIHLARAGWLRWSDDAAVTKSGKPAKGGLAKGPQA